MGNYNKKVNGKRIKKCKFRFRREFLVFEFFKVGYHENI